MTLFLPVENKLLAEMLGYSKCSIRKLVERGKLIAVLRGNTYFSHPTLVYEK